MGKYSDLIDQLNPNDKQNPPVYNALIDADGRAFRPLVRALREHPDEDVRHDVAHILGERGHWKAIPYLIDALDDPSEYVRSDALRSIELICFMDHDALNTWLDLEPDPIKFPWEPVPRPDPKTGKIDLDKMGEWFERHRIEPDPAVLAGNKRKVQHWWEVNRQFIEGNPELDWKRRTSAR